MTRPDEDSAYKALRSIAEGSEAPPPENLLLKVYALQREHQFDRDRNLVCQKLKAAIVQELERQEHMNQGSST